MRVEFTKTLDHHFSSTQEVVTESDYYIFRKMRKWCKPMDVQAKSVNCKLIEFMLALYF